MALGKSAAVVVGSFPLGESDRVVTFFSREHGKVRGVAKAARRMRSRFGGALQLFTEPYLFTGGGPVHATTTILLLIYDYAFTNSLGGKYGMATALSVMLAIFLGLLSWVYFRLTNRWSTS